MQRLKKLLLKNYQVFIISLFAVSIISSRMIFAADDWATTQGVGGFYSNATNGQVNQEGWWAKSMMNTMNFASGAVGGCSKTEDPECPDGMELGANGMLATSVVALTTTSPATSIEYLADIGRSIGIVPKEAYAEGFGTQVLAPLLSLWKVFRNIAYLALVVVFVIIGFMIMFRKKLNPQTVITVQQAIPRIIVTMLLITFSYAIAGLVVDITQFATRLIGTTFMEAGLIGNVRADEAAKGITSTMKLNALLNTHTFGLVNPLTSTSALAGAIRAPGGFGRGIFAFVLQFVFVFTMFFAMFKIFFSLIGPFVSLVLSIVFAPIQLLVLAIPGKSNIWGWLGGLIANAAVFPVTFTMLCLAAIFKSGPVLARTTGSHSQSLLSYIIGGSADWATKATPFGLNWAPPVIGSWGGAVGEVVGFGILLMIPKTAEMVKKMLEVKDTGLGGLATDEIKKGFGKIPLMGNVLGS